MRELRPGVWHWQSPHPDWDEEQWWPAFVSSYAIEVPIDPAEDPTPSPLKLLAHSTLRRLDTTVCRRPNLRQHLTDAKSWVRVLPL